MRNVITGWGLPVLLGLAAPAATAQEVEGIGSDYDALVEELPIESEAYGPAFTFTNRYGGILNFYGQLNLTYQSFDDGGQTTSGVVDNGNWNTRLGATLTQPLDNATIRFRFETGLGLRNSGLVSQTFTPDWIDWQKTSLRWFEVAADTDYGTISAGQGATASDGTAGLDDSFTFIAGATNSTDGFGSFRFRDTNGNLTNVSIAQVNNAFNGARRFRLRYDTPVVNGFMASTSYGVNILVDEDDADYYDIALRWTGDFGDFAVRSAAGYQWIDDPDRGLTQRVAASATLVHEPTGLNLAVSTGQQIDGASYIWGRAGWQTGRFGPGQTSLSVDYYNGSDFRVDGARTENYGVYAVYSLESIPLNLYGGWRRFSYSDFSGTTFQDADSLLVGARLYF